MTNTAIRLRILKQRWTLNPTIKKQLDSVIYNKTFKIVRLRNPSKYIACYWPMENEVDSIAIINDLLEGGHKVCLPYITNSKMFFKPITTIHFEYEYWKNMRQPVAGQTIDIKDIELMIVPVVAFNKRLQRLGYGLHFYNDYLKLTNKIYTVGLAYDFQLNNDFKTTARDKILDIMITN
ncbi:MAG: 5-formyltetrahydrofolate cyclo-ligase [Mycoplasmataceae bacterium]|nr:5-formyltetrahydrofolate cyclo-ligase [Mycoplasmataceae bacterium]